MLGSNLVLEFLSYWVVHDDGKRGAACWILNSNADQMLASFKRFHFRLLAHLTLKWQPILKCVMFWSGSLWGPFRATMVVHLHWRVVPFWYEDTHGAETDAGGMRTALSTGGNTDCKDNGGAGRRTWSCNMPPRVEKTEVIDCFLNLSAMILICSNGAQSTLLHLVSACRFIGRTWQDSRQAPALPRIFQTFQPWQEV